MARKRSGDGATGGQYALVLLPSGGDDRPVNQGDTVYDERGGRWIVAAIGNAMEEYDIWVRLPEASVHTARAARSVDFTHDRPSRSPKEIAKTMMSFADMSASASPETLRRWADELSGA